MDRIANILRYKARAAQMTAASRGTDPGTANVPFTELVRAGKFTCINDGFKPGFDSKWTTKGDRVRGDFALINMGRDYRETELAATLERKSKSLNCTFRLATAYELAYYATHGWSGSNWIVAFGSSYDGLLGNRGVACLWGNGTARELYLGWANNRWDIRDLVLCVVRRKNVP